MGRGCTRCDGEAQCQHTAHVEEEPYARRLDERGDDLSFDPFGGVNTKRAAAAAEGEVGQGQGGQALFWSGRGLWFCFSFGCAPNAVDDVEGERRSEHSLRYTLVRLGRWGHEHASAMAAAAALDWPG